MSSLVLLTQLGGRGNGFIHLSMKKGCLFVLFVLMRSTKSNQDASDCVLGVF